jgi:hypothetical protein
MLKNDNELEKYLSEFQPRGVRPLDVRQAARNSWLGWLAAAALALISVGAGLWYVAHGKKMERDIVKVDTARMATGVEEWKPNTILLTKMALEDPRRFEEQIDQASRRVLPDLRGQQSTLGVFAKE